jgi:hypothetical protein
MAQLIGSVTRKVGNTITDAQQTAQGNVGCFVARTANGTKIDDFRNLNDARRALERTFGGKLRWNREDLRGAIEHWVARGPLSDPLDIYGSGNLLAWNEMDVGVQVAPGTTDIVLVGDQALQRNNLTAPATQEPTLAIGAEGRPTATFLTDQLSSSIALAPTVDLCITAVGTATGGATNELFSTDVATVLAFGLSGGNRFYLQTSLGTDTALGAVLNQSYCWQLVYRAGGPTCTLYINGVAVISNAGTFTAGTAITVGGIVNSWVGNISMLVVAQDSSDANRALMFAYASKRYLQ